MLQIIERNAFRILGLSITASDRDVARREEELQAHLTIGQLPTFDTDFPWIGDIDRSEESVRRALQVLNDPSLKLEHSLFWFWECTAEDILAMDSLREGNQAQASIVWNRAIDESGVTHGTLTHFKNIAILSLIQAFGSQVFDHAKFINSIENWGRVLSSEYLMNRLTLLHPQLKNHMEDDRLSDVVGKCIYSSTKRYFSQWIQENDCEKAAACLGAFSKGGFSQEFQRWVTGDVTEPIFEEIERLCSGLSSLGFADMGRLQGMTLRFQREVLPLLEDLRKLLPMSDLKLMNVCDEVGRIVRNNGVEYGNQTEDWKKSKEFCEWAYRVVLSPLPKETLRQDIETLSQNVYYRKKAPAAGGGGCAALIFSLLLLIVAAAVFTGDKNRSRYDYSMSTTSRSSALAGSQLGNPQYDESHSRLDRISTTIDSLEKEIQIGESQLLAYESELNAKSLLLESYKKRLEQIERDIEAAESRLRQGLYVDESQYRSELAEHNSLVETHNATLAEGQELLRKHEQLRETVNRKIDSYNQLIQGK